MVMKLLQNRVCPIVYLLSMHMRASVLQMSQPSGTGTPFVIDTHPTIRGQSFSTSAISYDHCPWNSSFAVYRVYCKCVVQSTRGHSISKCLPSCCRADKRVCRAEMDPRLNTSCVAQVMVPALSSSLIALFLTRNYPFITSQQDRRYRTRHPHAFGVVMHQ